jgi:hypothetical protein
MQSVRIGRQFCRLVWCMFWMLKDLGKEEMRLIDYRELQVGATRPGVRRYHGTNLN